MSKIAIVTDSTSNLPDELVSQCVNSCHSLAIDLGRRYLPGRSGYNSAGVLHPAEDRQSDAEQFSTFAGGFPTGLYRIIGSRLRYCQRPYFLKTLRYAGFGHQAKEYRRPDRIALDRFYEVRPWDGFQSWSQLAAASEMLLEQSSVWPKSHRGASSVFFVSAH